MSILTAGLTLMISLAPIPTESECLTFRVESEDLDLAPLPGFVDACSRDIELCTALTSGYPPSVRTVGYFVLEDEWATFEETRTLGFTVYLIAQIVPRMSETEFTEFAEMVRAQLGVIPDNTELPAVLEKQGQESLGVLGETDDSITIGSAMRFRTAGTTREISTVSSNVALQLPGKTMSLYVFHPANEPADLQRLVDLTERWLGCLRTRNQTSGSVGRVE